MINWPDSFPEMLRDGYKVERVDNLMSTGFESGMMRTRQRFETVPSIVTVSFLANAAQGRAFELWYKHAIDGGAAWFNAPIADPFSSTNRGTKTEMYNSKFIERYDGPSVIGAGLWKYKMKLMVLPIAEFEGGDDWGQFPDYLVGASLLDLIMNDQWPLA